MAYDSHNGRRGHDIRPMSIPSMVPNAAAGRVAIEYGLTGPNTTVAAGQLSGLQSLTIAARFLKLGHATQAVAGAVEELSAERMMADRVLRSPHERIATPAAEACGLAVLIKTDEPIGTEFVGVCYGYSTGTDHDRRELLTRLIRTVLRRHDVTPGDLTRAYLSQASSSERRTVEQSAVAAATGGTLDTFAITDLVGDTASATGSLQLSTALALGTGHSLLTMLGPSGETAAALLRHCA
jgi:3-oxoacyl-[acyl-carrier-protein] synthase II